MTTTSPVRYLKVFVLLSFLLSIAVAGPYKKMRIAAEIPHLARLQAAASSIPRETFRVEAGQAGGAKVRLAMERIGWGNPEPLLIMLHGVLSDRRVWRYMAGDLAQDHDLLLIDLLGCGESDRPNPARMAPDGYSPSAQARRVLIGLRNYFRQQGYPARLTLVAHSLGGAVVLRMLGEPELRVEFPDVVARVEHAVLLAPLDFAVEKENATFVEILKLGRTKVALAVGLGILRGRLAQAARSGYSNPDDAPREGTRQQIDILRRRDSRRATKAMIRQAVPFHRKARRPDWEAIEELVADYDNVTVPTLILWGARDETLPVSMGYKLRSQLPHAWLRVLKETKHSLPTERPALSAEIIRQFLHHSVGSWEAVGELAVARRPAVGTESLSLLGQ